MRISTTMMYQNYTNMIENKTSDVQKYSDQVSSGMKFQRASDDPVSAMQTLEACHEYAQNEQYQSSYSSADSWMQNTESTLNQLNTIIQSAQEKLTEAANGTNASDDDADNATALADYQQEILTALNTQVNGRYVFGQGASDPAPFRLGTDSSGATRLQFYDYNKALPASQVDADGYAFVNTMTQANVQSEHLSDAVDLGLGIQVSGGAPVSGTYFQADTSGLDAIVAGFTGTGSTAVNLVDTLQDTVTKLKSGDSSTVASALTVAQNAQSAVLNVTVDVGERRNMLSFVSSTLSAGKTNIESSLSSAMDADTTEASMDYTMSMTVYKASLSVAASALQESLVDFLK